MYMGHAGIALLGKGVRVEVPLWVLIGAAFGLDLVKYGLVLAGVSAPELYANSIPAALCIASVAGVAYYGGVQRDGSAAALVALVALSHWPADFITGRVPLWPFGSEAAGLRFFLYGWWNFAFEASVVLAGWLVYRRSLAPEARRSWAMWAIPGVLLAFQLLFLYEN